MANLKQIGTLASGEFSVFKVAAKLGFMGYRIWKPVVDDHGIDLLIPNEDYRQIIRIQVKASPLKTRIKTGREKPSEPYYEFSLFSRRIVDGKAVNLPRIFSKEVDFVILHGQDEDKYWIVPAEILDNRRSVSMSTAPLSRPEINWTDLEARKAAGESYRKLAESTGLSFQAIYERLKGITRSATTDFTNTVRSFENRWELIEEFLAPTDSVQP